MKAFFKILNSLKNDSSLINRHFAFVLTFKIPTHYVSTCSWTFPKDIIFILNSQTRSDDIFNETPSSIRRKVLLRVKRCLILMLILHARRYDFLLTNECANPRCRNESSHSRNSRWLEHSLMRSSFSLRSFDTISMRGRSIRVLPCKMKIAFPRYNGRCSSNENAVTVLRPR